MTPELDAKAAGVIAGATVGVAATVAGMGPGAAVSAALTQKAAEGLVGRLSSDPATERMLAAERTYDQKLAFVRSIARQVSTELQASLIERQAATKELATGIDGWFTQLFQYLDSHLGGRPVSTAAATGVSGDLVALGTDVVRVGEIIGGKGLTWRLCIDNFVVGGLLTLTAFAERFAEIQPMDRYVLVNSLGDGRVIAEPPSWRKRERGIQVELQVEPLFPRIPAQDLPEDLKMVEEDVTGDLATVKGVDALPQRIQLCLWHQQGQLPRSGAGVTAVYSARYRQ